MNFRMKAFCTVVCVLRKMIKLVESLLIGYSVTFVKFGHIGHALSTFFDDDNNEFTCINCIDKN